jgi:DNA damage-binding protein 1
VVILGQRQITFCALNHYKVMPIPPALLLCWDVLPPDISGMPRFLLGDEFGNLHMLTLITHDTKVIALQLDTLGSCTLASRLQYLDAGLVFCGSTLGDSQLVQIHDEPIPVEDDDDDDTMEDGGGAAMANDANCNFELGDTTYLSVVEEYIHLGPIVDFDLVPMASDQSQVVTASGSSKSGTLRMIRNGIGMKEYASVELSGIQNMWSLRQSFDDDQDTYLVQSFVGETRVLGVVNNNNNNNSNASSSSMEDDDGGDPMQQDNNDDEDEEVGGSLEEVVLPGLESQASTLFVTNVVGNVFLQITETQLRLASADGVVLDTHTPPDVITVAAANEAGQIVVALRGGNVLYFCVSQEKLQWRASKQMDREVSCLNVHPYSFLQDKASTSQLVAVGLWDDFTVRLLSLHDGTNDLLQEVLQIHLSTDEGNDEDDTATTTTTTTTTTTHQEGQQQQQARLRSNRNNMMARSLCLITLDVSSSTSSYSNSHANNQSSTNSMAAASGVNMLFVGLGDGTLVSFAVVQEHGTVTVQSKKEVSLGTQRINLIPLHNPKGGTCVLATGDRPTVIYLAGASSGNYNPKLCYSNVNLSPPEPGGVDDPNSNASNNNNEGGGGGLAAQQHQTVNVAAPFFSPLLFADILGADQEQYSLCVADDAHLRLGVIDDIQKLHVTTCRLGMAPRRIVHCPEGRLFAVGCIESGIKQVGVGGGEMTLGNCIRFLDDTTFDDLERYVFV